MSKDKRIRWAVIIRWGGTLLSSALFIWLLARQDWQRLLTSAAGVGLWTLAAGLALYVISFGFNTLRWCFLLWAQNTNISFWQAWRLTWAGNFASNFLPSTIGGDGFRMLAIYPYAGRKTIAIGSVALDRIINMAAMTCLVPLSLWMFGAKLMTLFSIALPAPVQKLVDQYFPRLAAAFRDWAARPLAFVWAFLAAWPSNLAPMLATYLVARQLGIEVSYIQVMAVQTVTYFLSVLPISVNGYGLREVAYTTLYAALGASLEQASALALITRFLMVTVTLPGAFWLTGAATGSMEE